MKFGERLREIRKQQGISQRDLAARIERDFTYISKIETSDMPPPSAATIHRIAQALDADETELLVLAGKIPLEAYRQIVQGLAETDPYVYNDNNGRLECLYCSDFYGWGPDAKHTRDHDAECLWLKASKLVKTEQEKQS